MPTREDIANAVNVVDGVRVSPYSRETTKPGEGYVRLSRMDWPNKFGPVTTWGVVVFLPSGNLATAERWIESNVDDLTTALASVLRITSASPATDGGSSYYLLIEGN